MFAILFTCQFVAVEELVVSVLQEIDPTVDDILIGGQSLLELFIPTPEIKILPVPSKVECFVFVSHQLHVIFQEACPLLEIVASLLFRVELFFVDEVFDEGIDVRL